METQTITRADVLAMLARHVRQHYGSRLAGLYALRDDPYEPSGESFAIHMVALLREPFEFYQEVDATSVIADAVNREVLGSYVTTIYPASAEDQDGPALTAREQGVLL